MAILFHNPQTVRSVENLTTYTLTDYAVPSVSDRVLLVMAGLQRNNESAFTASCAYGAAGLTEAIAASATASSRYWMAYIWFLIAPAVGTADVTVTASAGLNGAVLEVTTLGNVDQTTPKGATATGTGNPACAMAFTGLTAGSRLLATVVSDTGGPPSSSWTNGVERYDLAGFSDVTNRPAGSGADFLSPGGNLTMTATRSAAALGQVGCAVEFMEAAGAAAHANRLTAARRLVSKVGGGLAGCFI